MADTDGDPVGVALLDPEMESFIVGAFFKTRLHDGELIARAVLRFYMIVCQQLDVGVLEGGRELELWRLFPYVCAVD